MPYWFRSRFAIFALTLLLRAGLAWQVLKTDTLPHFWRASEPATIAAHLLAGEGYASPYGGNAPTAWLAPIYPGVVVALVFGALGSYTAAATYCLVALNIVFAALTALLILELGKRIFDERTGALAGWLWAACVPSAIMPLLVWDTCLAALMLAGGLLLSLRLRASCSNLRWSVDGTYWGLACLVNPAIVAPLPFWWAACSLRSGRHGIRIRQLAFAIGMFAATVTPWMLRNYRVFHKPVFIRSNFGAELYFGNLGFESHPFNPVGEYQRVGEIPFATAKQQAAFKWICNHPAEFALRSLKRVLTFWTTPKIAQWYWLVVSLLTFAGAALVFRERSFGGLLIVIPLLVYPLAYYVTYVFPKYRFPLEPLMMVLCAHAVLALFGAMRSMFGTAASKPA